MLSFTEHLLGAPHCEGIELEDTKLVRSELAQDPGIVVPKPWLSVLSLGIS